jgi:hypothetical protein
VRRIVERHDGTARIDTAPLGGARVVLDLPLSYTAALDSAAAASAMSAGRERR